MSRFGEVSPNLRSSFSFLFTFSKRKSIVGKVKERMTIVATEEREKEGES